MPSYAPDVAPLIERLCRERHAPETAPDDPVLTGYAALKTNLQSVRDDVGDCSMPESDAAPPDAERVLVLDRTACGGPRN